MQTQDIKNSESISQAEKVMRVDFRNAVTEKASNLWDTDRVLAGKLNIAAEGIFYSREKLNEQGIERVVQAIPTINEPTTVIEQMVSIYKAMTPASRACAL